MRQSVKAVLSAVALLIILILINFSFGRPTVPDIADFFSERDGVWQNVRHSDYPDRKILSTLGLRDSVTIVRDERGVPHIFADNQHDAQLALGYVTAQDRFFQLFYNPRIVAGQLSEWMGQNYAKVDRAFLDLGLERAAWRYHNSMSQQEYDMVNAYKRGINSYLNRNGISHKPLESKIRPIEFRYWRPVDCARSWKYWEFLLSYNYDDPLNQYVINNSSEQVNELLFPDGEGSDTGKYTSNLMQLFEYLNSRQNIRKQVVGRQNFDVRGSIVAAGAGAEEAREMVMAADMHLPLSLPSHLYEVHIVTPESNIHGVTFPGIPVVLSGFNNEISWSVTPSNADLVDFRRIEVDEAGRTFRYAGGYEEHNISERTYPVQSRNGGASKHTVQFSGQGVLINTPDLSYEMSWSAHSSSAGTMLNYWNLNNAGSSSSAVRYGKSLASPTMELVLAGREGELYSMRPEAQNLGDQTPGLSVQQDGMSANKATITWRVQQHEGMSGFSELDVLKADNRSNANLVKPLHPWKMRRLNELTNTPAALTVGRAKDIQQDVKLEQELLLPYILETASGSNDQGLNELAEALEAWDFQATINSRLPVFWNKFMRILRRNIWDEIPDAGQPSDRFWLRLVENEPDHPVFDKQSTNEEEDFQALVDQSVKEAYEMAVIENGNLNSWSWVTSTIVRPFHISGHGAFDELVDYPVSRQGFPGTIQEVKRRNVPFGPVWKMVVDFSRKPVTGHVMTRGGVSGNPFSRYYNTGFSESTSGRYYEVTNVASPEDMANDISTTVMAPVK